eukprot:114750-Chlamydomonas_euryale.AAC.1
MAGEVEEQEGCPVAPEPWSGDRQKLVFVCWSGRLSVCGRVGDDRGHQSPGGELAEVGGGRIHNGSHNVFWGAGRNLSTGGELGGGA